MFSLGLIIGLLCSLQLCVHVDFRDSKAGNRTRRARENCLPRGDATRGGNLCARSRGSFTFLPLRKTKDCLQSTLHENVTCVT